MSVQKQKSELAEIVSYTIPRLYTGKEWYVGFYAYDPIKEGLHRKKIKLNYIEKVKERREYANDLIIRLYEKLKKGWNPWIAKEDSKGYSTFLDACQHYHKVTTHNFSKGIIREDTYISYMSYLNNLKKYNIQRQKPINYIYQLDKHYIIDFLEHVYIDRENSAQTRNNYLGWMGIFETFLVGHGYHKERATEGIESIGKGKVKKEREYLPEDILYKVSSYIENTNKHFQLASYILFYMFIRPKEMSRLRISDINLKKRTIVIKGHQSKNHKSAAITIPKKIIYLMLELKIFEHPGHYYLFSDKFRPGEKYRNEKQFRDFWQHYVRKRLNLPSKYKFYSLKDTGVTMMLRQKTDILSVRDQARHSSILITDTYTPHDIVEANPLIDAFECSF